TIKELNPSIQVILMTGYTDIKTAVNVMKIGAFDYVAKPINSEEILHTINKALSEPSFKTVTENVDTQEPNKSSTKKNNSRKFVNGKSKRSKELHEFIDVVAPTNISV